MRHLELGTTKFRKEILTNPQVTALLRAAVETDLELLPYQLLCVFAGIRPKEVAQNKILICCSKPLSDLRIEA